MNTQFNKQVLSLNKKWEKQNFCNKSSSASKGQLNYINK